MLGIWPCVQEEAWFFKKSSSCQAHYGFRKLTAYQEYSTTAIWKQYQSQTMFNYSSFIWARSIFPNLICGQKGCSLAWDTFTLGWVRCSQCWAMIIVEVPRHFRFSAIFILYHRTSNLNWTNTRRSYDVLDCIKNVKLLNKDIEAMIRCQNNHLVAWNSRLMSI